jgi:hypothetical protein
MEVVESLRMRASFLVEVDMLLSRGAVVNAYRTRNMSEELMQKVRAGWKLVEC